MSLNILTNERLSNYTTLHIGGVADYVVSIKSIDELREALLYAKDHTSRPPLILGGGSNVLCSDDGYRGLVIINQIKGYEVIYVSNDSISIRVGAGEVFDEIIMRTIADGYWGLENLSAIPGSVGATPIQNVGAYGVEISEVTESVDAMHIHTQEQKKFTKEMCAFGYRDSFFKSEAGKQWCVFAVTYVLSKNPKPILSYADLELLREHDEVTQQEIRAHIINVRSRKFPDWRTIGTAGSFFKNPIVSHTRYAELKAIYPELPGYEVDKNNVKLSLGWILDKICNVRGYKEGNVRLYEEQALVLVAETGATQKEVDAFVEKISKKVFEKLEITVEREVLRVS